MCSLCTEYGGVGVERYETVIHVQNMVERCRSVRNQCAEYCDRCITLLGVQRMVERCITLLGVQSMVERCITLLGVQSMVERCITPLGVQSMVEKCITLLVCRVWWRGAELRRCELSLVVQSSSSTRLERWHPPHLPHRPRSQRHQQEGNAINRNVKPSAGG